MPTDHKLVRFLGIDFANMSYPQVANELERLALSGGFSYIVTPNVDHVVQLHEGEDPAVASAFREAYRSASLRLCDSRVLQLLARFRGVDLDVVTGSDLTAYLFTQGYLDGRRIAVIGGDKNLVDELRRRYPSIEVTQHQPPMGVINNPTACAQAVDFVSESSCDFIFFAIGAPQSELIAHQCLESAQARGVGLCVGASIEFLLGRKARAPRWMQRAKLEWAFRLLSEPRRLWRRYLIVGPRVFRLALNRDDF
jgi:exopolysaccharide biosynthesis WecB/TagA/CpsF family protein